MSLVLRICILLLCASTALAAENASTATDGLELALRLTAHRHPSVTSKQEELRALGFDLESAEYQRYPTMAVQASVTNNIAGSIPNNVDDQNHAVVAVVRQPLWVGGRIDGHIDQAAVKLEIGKLSLRALQRQLMESTVATYAGAQGARRRLEAADLNVREHELLQASITRRESGGIAALADVQLASSRLSEALVQRIQIEAALQRSLNDLQALTLQPMPAMEPVPADLIALPATDQIVGEIELVSATLQQRQKEVALAQVAVDLTTAEMLPSLYAKLEQDLYTSTNDGEESQGTRVGLVMEGSVEGLGFANWKKVKSSDARAAAARREVENARNELRRQVHALLTDLQSLQLAKQSNELLVASTEQTLASFIRQYDAGRKSWVDVMNSQRERSAARLSLSQVNTSLQETRLRLGVQLGHFDQQAAVLP